MSVIAGLKVVKAPGKIGLTSERLAKPDIRPQDFDARLDRDRAQQNTGEHQRSVPGEREGGDRGVLSTLRSQMVTSRGCHERENVPRCSANHVPGNIGFMRGSWHSDLFSGSTR